MKNGDPRFDDKKYFGIYRAIVRNVADEKKLGRIILQVPEIFGTDLLTDWAWPKSGYLSGADKGDFLVPDVDDGVWVEFEAGDAHRPVYSGRWWGMPGGTPEVPKLAREQKDESQSSPKGTDVMIKANGSPVNEPAISYAAKYPSNRVFKTKRGIVVELDDTEGNVRIHVWHPKKTFFEINKNGGLVERIQDSRYSVVVVNDRLHVKGDHDVCVDGAASLRVAGDYELFVGGKMKLTVGGNYEETIVGDMSTDVTGDQKTFVEKNITREAQGDITDSGATINQNPDS